MKQQRVAGREGAVKSLSLRGKDTCFLVSFGHCGIDYLHSLIDGNPGVLIMPAFSFYRSWKMLGCGKESTAEGMFRLWKDYINGSPGMQHFRRRLLRSDRERERFFPVFRDRLEKNGVSRKDVFLSIHEAYLAAASKNVDDIRIIVSQEHVPFHMKSILEDFPSTRVLQIVRDPRATMAGAFRHMTRELGCLPDYYFNYITEYWMQGAENWRHYRNRLGSRYRVVRNEDLHASLDRETKELAGWMGVPWSDSFLRCTFAGEEWGGESAYMTDEGKYPVPEEVFYLPENVKKRWLRELEPSEIAMIEFLTSGSMKEFGYERMTPDNIFTRIRGFALYVLPHRGLLRVWSGEYPRVREFGAVSGRLRGPYARKLWNTLPAPLKFAALVLRSVLVRVRIILAPGERGRRYI